MDIYIYAGSVFVYTGKFDFTNCCGGGSNPFAGTAETGDAKECCDEEHAGNDDNPPRVCEQSLFADRNALRFVFAADVVFRGGNGVVTRKAARADAEAVHHFRQTL